MLGLPLGCQQLRFCTFVGTPDFATGVNNSNGCPKSTIWPTEIPHVRPSLMSFNVRGVIQCQKSEVLTEHQTIQCLSGVGWLGQIQSFFSSLGNVHGSAYTDVQLEIAIAWLSVETKKLVCINSNVIMTRQTCSQRSSMAAESKRRALAFYFSMRTWCMFPMSKCRGESDWSPCTFPVLCEKNAAAQCRLSTNVLAKYVFEVHHTCAGVCGALGRYLVVSAFVQRGAPRHDIHPCIIFLSIIFACIYEYIFYPTQLLEPAAQGAEILRCLHLCNVAHRDIMYIHTYHNCIYTCQNYIHTISP